MKCFKRILILAVATSAFSAMADGDINSFALEKTAVRCEVNRSVGSPNRVHITLFTDPNDENKMDVLTVSVWDGVNVRPTMELLLKTLQQAKLCPQE